MDFSDYQGFAGDTAIYPNRGSNPGYAVLGLVGEAGEIANKWKKVLRDQHGFLTEAVESALIDEMGDVLWYLAALADELDVSLNIVAERNLKKLRSRQEHGSIEGSGDGR